MANFSIQTSIQVIPLEEITFTDTSQKAKGIHSTIDRVFGSVTTTSHSTTSTNVRKIDIDFDEDGITGETTFASLTSISGTMTSLYAVLTLDTDQEGVYLKLGGKFLAVFRANGIGDFISLPVTSIDGDDLVIGTGGAYTKKALTFLVGL